MYLARRAALLFLLVFAPTVVGQAPVTSTPVATPTISGPSGTYYSAVVVPNSGPVTLPGTWYGPAGTYAITLPGGSSFSQTANSITITWYGNSTPTATITPAVAAPPMPPMPTVMPMPPMPTVMPMPPMPSVAHPFVK